MNKLTFAIVMALCMWGSAEAGPQEPLFVPAPASPIMVGHGSGPVLLADVNRDGHLDIVTKHLLSRSVNVLLGDGKGHFIQAGGAPLHFNYDTGWIALGDVNGDGILDLGVATRDERREYVHVLLGDGKGGFKELPSSPYVLSDTTPKTYKPTLEFVDLNEDGKLDIIASNHRRNTIDILFGDGRGGFSPGPIVKPEPGEEYSFALGDINGDGHLDLVNVISRFGESADGSAHVSIRYGDGKGHFKQAPGSPFPAPPGARVLAVADVNGDGRPDIVLSHEANRLTILLNEGKSRFAQAPGSPIQLDWPVWEVIVRDINWDHIPDLICATVNHNKPFDSKIVVLLGDGHGGFKPAPGSPFPAERGAYTLSLGDVNEDGKIDIAASSFEADAVTVLLGK